MASPRALVLSPMLQIPSRAITINRALPRVQSYNYHPYKSHNFGSIKTNSSLPNLSFLRRFFSASPAQEIMASQGKTKAQAIIDENPVGEFAPLTTDLVLNLANCQPAVFSKSYCPYCKATKALLSEQGAKYYSIELDQVRKFTQSRI
jgi:thiol-disulfide isomerase/thioredoxin